MDSSRSREFSVKLTACREGSVEDLGALIETYRGYCLLLANRYLDPKLRVKVGASDVVQETFLLAQQRFEQFRGSSEPEWLGWIQEILVNQLGAAARRFRQTSKRQLDREQELEGSADFGEFFSDETTSPGSKLIASEEALALREALERIPAEYQQVIQLRSWKRLSFAEIGRLMDRSHDAARKLWSRAIERLQDELETIHEQSR